MDQVAMRFEVAKLDTKITELIVAPGAVGMADMADWDLATCWELMVGCGWYPLVMTNIAMGNVPCIDGLKPF